MILLKDFYSVSWCGRAWIWKGPSILSFSCLSVDEKVITPQHLAPLQPVQPSLTWTEGGRVSEGFTQQALTVTNLRRICFSGVPDHLPVRHKCSFFQVLCPDRKLTWATTEWAPTVALCAISISTKRAGARGVCRSVWDRCATDDY